MSSFIIVVYSLSSTTGPYVNWLSFKGHSFSLSHLMVLLLLHILSSFRRLMLFFSFFAIKLTPSDDFGLCVNGILKVIREDKDRIWN